MDISEIIYNQGLDVGYSRIGACKLKNLESYPIIDQLKLDYPFAKSMIISVWHYNFYKIPEHLKDIISKEDFFQGRTLKGSHEHKTARDLEDFFNQKKIAHVDVTHIDKTIKRKIAEQMDIGIIRKNGYFYTEEGSYCTLHAWLVDEAVEWQHEEAPDPCLGHCSICIRSCPETALMKGHVKDDRKCIAHNSKLVQVQGKALKTGCDHCQDVCPYNKHRWSEDENFSFFED